MKNGAGFYLLTSAQKKKKSRYRRHFESSFFEFFHSILTWHWKIFSLFSSHVRMILVKFFFKNLVNLLLFFLPMQSNRLPRFIFFLTRLIGKRYPSNLPLKRHKIIFYHNERPSEYESDYNLLQTLELRLRTEKKFQQVENIQLCFQSAFWCSITHAALLITFILSQNQPLCVISFVLF